MLSVFWGTHSDAVYHLYLALTGYTLHAFGCFWSTPFEAVYHLLLDLKGSMVRALVLFVARLVCT